MCVRSKCLLLCKSILLSPLFYIQHNHIQNLFYAIIQPTVECECKGENMCLHGALCPIPFNLICNMTMGAGSAGKIFATTLLHL